MHLAADGFLHNVLWQPKENTENPGVLKNCFLLHNFFRVVVLIQSCFCCWNDVSTGGKDRKSFSVNWRTLLVQCQFLNAAGLSPVLRGLLKVNENTCEFTLMKSGKNGYPNLSVIWASAHCREHNEHRLGTKASLCESEQCCAKSWNSSVFRVRNFLIDWRRFILMSSHFASYYSTSLARLISHSGLFALWAADSEFVFISMWIRLKHSAYCFHLQTSCRNCCVWTTVLRTRFGFIFT